MKPNEGYEIGEEDLVAQLGMLILDGRTPQDSKSNITGCVKCDDGLSGPRKKQKDFITQWTLCDSLCIEVWLYRQEQFNKREAMNGHGSYLLIEQWEIKLKLSRNPDLGFYCTEKMLTQAIRSKLYFSQLSAWLSLTKGEFPRYMYFRLCSTKEKTPLERFIRAPDFHQFPQVNINSTKELIVSLHSLPHSDLLRDYPMFSWVLNDLPSETPPRKLGEKIPENFDASLEGNDCFYGSTNQKKDLSNSRGNVVRKLEFKNFSSVGEKTSNMTKITSCVVKELSTVSVQNVNRTSVERFSKLGSSKHVKRETDCKYSTEEEQNLISDNERPQPQKGEFFCEEAKGHFSKQEATGFSNKHSEPLHASPKLFASNRATENNSLAQGASGDFKELICDEEGSPADKITERHSSLSSQGYLKKITPIEKQCFGKSLDSENFGTNLKCRKQEISKKSLLTCDMAARDCRNSILNLDKLQSSQKTKISNSKICDGLNCEGSGNLQETMRISWSRSIDECGNVLHRDENGIGNIISDVRHVMDKEYEKTLHERIGKCCLASEGYRGKNREDSTKKTMEADKTEDNNKDNVFRNTTCTTIPHARISRYHFRHASTGTLAVFHPRTGLPMSSSPAPFRKTSQKKTVDDICSPPREPSSLSDQCGNLSKSAPTLTTQSLLVNFEESVLNDRLLPDGVVEGFTAELSASGSKKCLAHVTLPVQAYFFKLSDDNAPSPYMGYISLDVPGLPKKGYHVPKNGTIQLTLFNPNQTVVKVFVVLYDFTDMQPNFQTFLRQKTTSLVKSEGLVDRIHDNLHYLIHLRFASSKSGRIYLHTDIRVIFARHPPDQVHLSTTTNGPTNPKYVPRQETREAC
ncbi:protein FAM214A-like [Dendronephthya gigantea]|uniref:protein FAM214A-like n=1 Tax=Dendronephthya gigantea TaxID=151771 RepID=UPI00106CC775|nr:protein FAM214A-like [Dendronephthya gigantea]